jgi:acetyltransferase
MSHTASLAGNRRIISGALAQAGIIEADDFKQMIDLCRSLDAAPPGGAGHRVAVMTFSGGAGIVSADFLAERGLELGELGETARNALREVFPPWMPVASPVDLWPAVESHMADGIDVYGRALAAVLADPGVDAVFLHTFLGHSRFRLDLAHMAELIRTSGKPVFIWQVGRRESAFEFRKEALARGIPVFSEIGRAVECLAAVLKYRRRPEKTPAAAADTPFAPEAAALLPPAAGPLDERLSKAFLASCGVPTVAETLVTDLGQVESAAEALGYPVVMKGLLPGTVHKTEAGLVRLGISDGSMARQTYAALMGKMGGRGQILVQRQLTGKVELILGLTRDPQFGPCVMFGLGGITAELFGDASFAVAPLDMGEALDLIGRIRARKMLDGFRGAPAVDREELARILVALGRIGLAYPRIREIDINPLLLSEEGLFAVDATLVLE